MEKAYILISLGAPENISADACRSFLREFLGDKHVLSLPFPLRQLLSAHIAKKRASQYAQNLETICGGSIGNHPSISAARSLAIQIQSITGVKTFSAFRYGAQNIPDAFRAAKKAGASSVKALPLYPQDAYSTTSSAFAEAASAAEEFGLGLEFNRSYFDNPEYISLIADSFRSQKAFRPDAAIVSFHSVPISHLKKTQYLQQCRATFESLKSEIGEGMRMELAWQSKMDKGDWLGPSAEECAKDLAAAGAKKVLVLCPGFSCDCTETLVEINIQLKTLFKELGGDDLQAVACLNDSPAHALMLARILERMP